MLLDSFPKTVKHASLVILMTLGCYRHWGLKTHRKDSPAATSSTCLALKGSFYLLVFTGSPVNGSIYSFSVILSYSKSSFN